MTSFNNGTIVKREDLKIGNIVKINTTIDVLDIVDPLSDTANRWVQSTKINNETHYQWRIRSGEGFNHYAVVITKPCGTNDVLVLYFVTFGRRMTLPTPINPAFWVPVRPVFREVGNHNMYDPISSIKGITQWVSIRRKINIKEEEVSVNREGKVGLLTPLCVTIGNSILRKAEEEASSATEKIFCLCSDNSGMNKGKILQRYIWDTVHK